MLVDICSVEAHVHSVTGYIIIFWHELICAERRDGYTNCVAFECESPKKQRSEILLCCSNSFASGSCPKIRDMLNDLAE